MIQKYHALECVTACGQSILSRYRTFSNRAQGYAWLKNNASAWHYGLIRADRVADVMLQYFLKNN